MSVIWLILILYGALSVLFAILYIPKLMQTLWAFYRIPKKPVTKKRRISVVIPARGESRVIGDLLHSLAVQDYDRALFAVNIIVKDADDPTVDIATKAGARVFVVPDQDCKGAALDGYFHAITEEERDSFAAFVIVDADAVLSPDYLSELNNALEYDKQIVVTRKRVKNYLGDRKARSMFCTCSSLNYPVLDDLGNIFRTEKGLPLNLCGQGLMVRTDVIRTIGGWPYRTLTEDYEMKKDGIVRGFTMMYYPYAVIYTEEVIRHKDCWSRRMRWVIGYSQSDKKYNKLIREKFKRERPSFLLWYETFFSLAPIIGFIVTTIVTALAGAGLSIAYAVIGSPLWLNALLLLTLMPLGIMYLLELIYCLITMICYRDALAGLSAGEWLAAWLFSPIFMFEYFPIFIQGQICIASKRKVGWQHTARVEYKNGAILLGSRYLERLRRYTQRQRDKYLAKKQNRQKK